MSKKSKKEDVIRCRDNCSAFYFLKNNSKNSLCLHPCCNFSVIDREHQVCAVYLRDRKIDALLNKLDSNL